MTTHNKIGQNLSMHDVTAFILSYNGLALAERCAKSLAESASGVEICVVDNGSTDGTEEYFRSKADKIRVVRNSQNLGLGKALNRAVRGTQSKYILLLNNDVVAKPGAVDALLRILEEDESVKMAFPRLYNEDGTVQHSGMAIDITAFSVDLNIEGEEPVDVMFQSGCVTMMRTQDFLRVGGYSEYLDWYVEDIDLAWKVHSIGGRVVVVPAARFIHSEGATLGKNLADRSGVLNRIYLRERNVLLVIMRNASLVHLAVQLPLVLVAQAIEALAALLMLRDIEASGQYIRAWSDAARLIGEVRQDSRVVGIPRSNLLRYVKVRWSKLGLALANWRTLGPRP